MAVIVTVAVGVAMVAAVIVSVAMVVMVVVAVKVVVVVVVVVMPVVMVVVVVRVGHGCGGCHGHGCCRGRSRVLNLTPAKSRLVYHERIRSHSSPAERIPNV